MKFDYKKNIMNYIPKNKSSIVEISKMNWWGIVFMYALGFLSRDYFKCFKKMLCHQIKDSYKPSNLIVIQITIYQANL